MINVDQIKTEFLKAHLIDPVSQRKVVELTASKVIFTNHSYPIHNGVPVLFNEQESIFRTSDVLNEIPTTQNKTYRKKGWKTFIRQKLLPSLSHDFTFKERYKRLASDCGGKTVLVIGAGDKIEWYVQMFAGALVITSDVHSQYIPDVVIDAHQIPFENKTFDIVIAGQVLEHTFQPWVVASEIERVCKSGGQMLIEVPFNFPYHGMPYDFFRFTFTGLRSLFNKSKMVECQIGEGNASAVATYNSQLLIDLFSNRLLRSIMLFISRILFGWWKYLDKLNSTVNRRSISVPKGFSMLFEKDDVKRSNSELLNEYFELKK
ncbi:class I SAM-dependent methyltransferase [Nonlabens agnitus]|uniref:Methyltransferase type 11 domain-containing protein n=1 Tax=Nonlabens agnitus TaxID=870484 RepID=A0A2S9WU42_9FLAO|nr:class I SAM-dependent methyltransferase [Nonlabens agnitus]PRP66988.1 hypothetical protein BST86_07690 [Nonlabens agnitus]